MLSCVFSTRCANGDTIRTRTDSRRRRRAKHSASGPVRKNVFDRFCFPARAESTRAGFAWGGGQRLPIDDCPVIPFPTFFVSMLRGIGWYRFLGREGSGEGRISTFKRKKSGNGMSGMSRVVRRPTLRPFRDISAHTHPLPFLPHSLIRVSV